MAVETRCPYCGELVKYIPQIRTGDIVCADSAVLSVVTDTGRIINARCIHKCKMVKDAIEVSKITSGGENY